MRSDIARYAAYASSAAASASSSLAKRGAASLATGDGDVPASGDRTHPLVASIAANSAAETAMVAMGR